MRPLTALGAGAWMQRGDRNDAALPHPRESVTEVRLQLYYNHSAWGVIMVHLRFLVLVLFSKTDGKNGRYAAIE